MRRTTPTVQHFIGCSSVFVRSVGRRNPYTLEDVSYFFEVPADREWPVRLDGFWLYARSFNGSGLQEFAIEVIWLDGPDGEREICEFAPLAVQFIDDEPTLSWAWRIETVRYPGPGRYVFRLRLEHDRSLLNEEFIEIGRAWQ